MPINKIENLRGRLNMFFIGRNSSFIMKPDDSHYCSQSAYHGIARLNATIEGAKQLRSGLVVQSAIIYGGLSTKP
ncbi:hypothetical protein XarbCFBP6827_18280 [Xanthomonas arboricola]|nr:hypothetical protein XarbCFBP6827_18280 [Xanthomonas arboricola]